MVISEIEQTSPGVCKVTPEGESAFFLRTQYLSLLDEEALLSASYLNEEQSFDVLNAALIYSVETAAMSYLARAEQCRSGLTAKLERKGMNRKSIQIALDYLEEVGYLDDSRFAGAWLRSRSIDHTEGRIRLAAELALRGIRGNVACRALDEFFTEHDELELCRKAYSKCASFSHDGAQIARALQRKGFSLWEIKSVLNA